MSHRKSEWAALNEKLAQCEYEREDARRQWEHYRNENMDLTKQLAALRLRLYTASAGIRALLDA